MRYPERTSLLPFSGTTSRQATFPAHGLKFRGTTAAALATACWVSTSSIAAHRLATNLRSVACELEVTHLLPPSRLPRDAQMKTVANRHPVLFRRTGTTSRRHTDLTATCSRDASVSAERLPACTGPVRASDLLDAQHGRLEFGRS